MERRELIRLHPVLFHMAEDGAWPLIRQHGLLSARAIVDRFIPDDALRASLLGGVRTDSIYIELPGHGRVVVRDQAPLKFLDQCLVEGTTVQAYLDALNGRVFFWLSLARLQRLLGARRYRGAGATVIHVDTAKLLDRDLLKVQLAPYNTGSTHVPTAPRRGTDVFLDIDEYPYDEWRERRRVGDAAVELVVRYEVANIVEVTRRVERWVDGAPVKVVYEAGSEA